MIELLIVIAIIGLLMGILVPSLAQARDLARGMKCASNMRQLAIGYNLYAAANDGICIPGRMAKIGDGSDPRNHYWVGNGYHYRPRWMVTMGASAGFYAYAHPSTDPGKENDNNRHLEHDIFRDPAVPDYTNNRNYCIGYNFQFLGNSRTRADGRYVRFPVRVDEIGADTVLFADTLGTAATFAEKDRAPYNPTPHPNKSTRELCNHGWSLDPPRLTSDSDNCDGGRDGATRSAPARRHLDAANVAFVGGYVQRHTPHELGYRQDADGSYDYRRSDAHNRLFSGQGEDVNPPSVR